MIRTQNDFTNACDFIDSDAELYDFVLSDRMSSYEYNLYLQDTEFFLNFLYEKIRTLEELCDYLDHYADTKIAKIQQEIAEQTSLLQQFLVTDVSQDNVTTYPVWDVSYPIYDRDGSVLSLASTYKGNIEGADRRVDFIQPTAISRIDTNQAFAEQTQNFAKTGRYLIACEQDVVTFPEILVTVAMPHNKSFNTISFDPINADISVKKRDDNDIEIRLQPLRYKKEAQVVDFNDFLPKESIKPNGYRYDSSSSYSNNVQQMNHIRDIDARKQYVNDVTTYQQLIAAQTQKTEVAKL